VLSSTYKKRLRVAVAGVDDISACDVLIGTLHELHKLACPSRTKTPGAVATPAAEAEDTSDDDEEEEDVEAAPVAIETTNPAAQTTVVAKSANALKRRARKEPRPEPLIRLSEVRAIVVDEVDATLGPKFSNEGKLMKSVLKAIRERNGALAKTLPGVDYHVHQL